MSGLYSEACEFVIEESNLASYKGENVFLRTNNAIANYSHAPTFWLAVFNAFHVLYSIYTSMQILLNILYDHCSYFLKG